MVADLDAKRVEALGVGDRRHDLAGADGARREHEDLRRLHDKCAQISRVPRPVGGRLAFVAAAEHDVSFQTSLEQVSRCVLPATPASYLGQHVARVSSPTVLEQASV